MKVLCYWQFSITVLTACNSGSRLALGEPKRILRHYTGSWKELVLSELELPSGRLRKAAGSAARECSLKPCVHKKMRKSIVQSTLYIDETNRTILSNQEP
ncbi:hypothetical protein B0O99DRAFT_615094 [Bisporella sp. PMI_857]|nr:hypothetical protein B0O99DRAFT_615094 [Bisporella sp. PMI_857]